MKHLTKVLIISFLFSVFYFLGFGLAEAQTHPNFIAKQSDFNKIKNLIQQNKDPWKRQHDRLINKTNGYQSTPEAGFWISVDSGNFDVIKSKGDAGARELASLALACILSGQTEVCDKTKNQLLGWTTSETLAVLKSIGDQNSIHACNSMIISVALAYDWIYGRLSSSEGTQIIGWLSQAGKHVRSIHEQRNRCHNKEAWDDLAMIMAGLATDNSDMVQYGLGIGSYENSHMSIKRIINCMIQDSGQSCDYYHGCYEFWHNLMSIEAFAMAASVGVEHGYENFFNTQPDLVNALEYYAPLYQTNDVNSLPAGDWHDAPDWLYFSGIYEIAYKYLPNNQTIRSVLEDSNFNDDYGRYCENERGYCARWTIYPSLIWGQEIGVPQTKTGDLNNDGKVDIFDYNILIENFGNTSCGNVADIDANCKVDIFDYNILVENFGKT